MLLLPLNSNLPRKSHKYTLYFWVRFNFIAEIRDTLALLDKAIQNKETRTVSRITKSSRRYRNVIQAHHVLAIADAVGDVEFPRDLLRRSKDFKESFAEKFDLNKTVLSRVSKTLELEIFLKMFVVQILWREERYDDCLNLVNSLIEIITYANRRSLDNYNSVLLGYFSRIHEKRGEELSIR